MCIRDRTKDGFAPKSQDSQSTWTLLPPNDPSRRPHEHFVDGDEVDLQVVSVVYSTGTVWGDCNSTADVEISGYPKLAAACKPGDVLHGFVVIGKAMPSSEGYMLAPHILARPSDTLLKRGLSNVATGEKTRINNDPPLLSLIHI